MSTSTPAVTVTNVFLMDHLGTAEMVNIVDTVKLGAFLAGRYNGNPVVALINSEAESDMDRLLVNGDRVAVSAANNKGAATSVFLMDHLGTAAMTAIEGDTTLGSFLAGRYNGNPVVALINSESEGDMDRVLQHGDRVAVSAANNKGA